MIKVEGLSKIYGDNIAVDGISFEVKGGQIYGFLGPNGAGKSTTMNIITGYLSPTSGTVEINGYLMGKDTLKAKQSIGYLPEIPPLYPDMTVLEYLRFAASIKGIDKSERKKRVEEVMNATDIKKMENRLIKHLSKGYKQRVGIAQAILADPEVIILDEPTVGLDPEQIIEVRELIKSLKGKHTVIISSHILSEISATCDEVLVIANGRMVACDTTENLLKNQKSVKKLNMKIKGTKDKVEAVLSKVEEIEEFTFTDESDENVSVCASFDPSLDIREKVSFALSDERLLILEMSEETSTLEDIYLELVKQADEQYRAEMEALEAGKDLDEVFDTEESETKEEEKDDTDESVKNDENTEEKEEN